MLTPDLDKNLLELKGWPQLVAPPPLIFSRGRPTIKPPKPQLETVKEPRPVLTHALEFDIAQAEQFLTALYGDFFSKNKGYIEVRFKAEGERMQTTFYPNPDALLEAMVGWPKARHYWAGVAPRNNNQGGKKEDVAALNAIYSDLDCGTEGHAGATPYETKAEAQAAVEQCPFSPSILVDTGGGVQPYWLFKEPIQSDNGNLVRVERVLKGFAAALRGDPMNAAQILRLPGTYNMKLAGNPRPVKMIYCNPECTYTVAELEQWAEQFMGQEQAQRGVGKKQGSYATEYDAYAQKALTDELTKLARSPHQADGRNIQLNKSAFALGQLVGAEVLDRSSVEAGLYGVALSIGLGEVETRATIRSGFEAGIKEPRRLPEKEARAEDGAKRKAGGQAQGDPQGQEEGEPERIPWVGHFYCVQGGRLSKADYDGKKWEYKPLANFQARIQEEVTRDDGLRTSKEFQIEGSLDTGRPLPLTRIPAREYDSLKWITREWGAAAAMAPGRSLGPHLANAIQAHSQKFKRRTVFAHTGWRKINGVWRYLHGGGAIGPGDPVEVDLGENLGLYRLSEPGGIEAAQASLRFLNIGPWKVTVPLIACVYLAPFADLCEIDFSLWLYGRTGKLKSTLAALALSHYGHFTYKTLPGSWISSVNSLEKLIFILKDTLCVIDDFNPPANQKESHTMIEKAGRLVYQIGNRSSRGRLAPDLTTRPNHYPRSLVISTGEMMLPGQRQSATARYLGIDFNPQEITVDMARLTAAQEEQCLYPQAMAAYLDHLAPRLDDTLPEIQELWEGYRKAFQSGGHLRVPTIQAWFAVGFEYFMKFQTYMGSITQDQADEMLNRAWKVIEALGEKHSHIIEGERPSLKFMATLRELFYQGKIYAESANTLGSPPPRTREELGWRGGGGLEPARNAELVGWADENYLYLIPEATIGVIRDTIRRRNDYLSSGKNELLEALARDGFIEPAKEENTRLKWIQGGTKRVIFLPLEKLACEGAENS